MRVCVRGGLHIAREAENNSLVRYEVIAEFIGVIYQGFSGGAAEGGRVKGEDERKTQIETQLEGDYTWISKNMKGEKSKA